VDSVISIFFQFQIQISAIKLFETEAFVFNLSFKFFVVTGLSTLKMFHLHLRLLDDKIQCLLIYYIYIYKNALSYPKSINYPHIEGKIDRKIDR